MYALVLALLGVPACAAPPAAPPAAAAPVPADGHHVVPVVARRVAPGQAITAEDVRFTQVPADYVRKVCARVLPNELVRAERLELDGACAATR